MTALVGFEAETESSFQAILPFVERRNYPNVWKEIVKMKTVIPATVCCEQSFTILKHALHRNMATKTIMAKVTLKCHENVEIGQKQKDDCWKA